MVAEESEKGKEVQGVGESHSERGENILVELMNRQTGEKSNSATN